MPQGSGAGAPAPPVPQRPHRTAAAAGAGASGTQAGGAGAAGAAASTQPSMALQLAAHIQTLQTDQFYEAYLEGHSELVQPAALPESFVLGCKPAANSLLHLFGEWLFEAAVTGLRIDFKTLASGKPGGKCRSLLIPTVF